MTTDTTTTTATTGADDLTGLSGDYTIDVSHTRIGFVARHAMITKVRGAFNDIAGTLHIDGPNPSASHGTVTIQAKSIDTRNSDRDNHLRSNDFFAMDEFPEITFVSTEVNEAGDGHFAVTGDLTIRGTTKPVTVDFELTGAVKDPFGNSRIGLEGSVVVNRKDWGVSFNAALEAGGVMVSEKVTIELEVSAIKS